MKKRTAAALCALMLAALFSGCTAGNKGNTLRVALSPDYAPMEFVDLTKTGQAQFVGFDVSLANYIADGLGMELEILPMSFDACMTAVSVGSADMAISGFSWMPDREESYNLSDYYYAGRNETEQVLITLASNGGKFPNAESLAGHKVGAQAATLQENLCKSQLPGSETIPFATIDTGLMMLEKGDFAAMAVAAGNAEAILANNPQFALAGFRFAVSEKEANNLILLQKGNDALTEQVNALLAEAEAAGLYEVWYEEALAIAGAEVAYDENGNVAAEPAEST